MLAVLLALTVAFASPASPAPRATTAPSPQATTTPSPQRLLGLIRLKFRSHRPPPPFEIYTIARKQNTDRGFPDYPNSYQERIWIRNLDRAALSRRILIVPAMGPPTFERPAFNEDYDPGPPTADLFEPAPAKPHPISDVPTPEPTNAYQVIGRVVTVGEYDYNVTSVTPEGDQLHLVLEPIRDPERNRLRELWVNRDTLELTRIKSHDRLFVPGGPHGTDIYGVIFDIKIAMLQGIPVVTDIHGIVGDNFTGDGQIVDYTFRNISFPQTLPDWYFDARSYAQHQNDLPKF
jgi:hypothetical protein